ncbi:hypothetical protein KFL_001050055 [Klebsormidium nitens]|uniref:Uncharacterized protein n=1 Tax=Klebsormidium nitens TaxID=105231 RepID=A0A1Y1HUD3_KLENI|nr:hypothetical protein KFL_001050055 [Klebsormidium nitens]|eukprot:GAQ82240.1 hypothetical protein KFL_001050055 [Klebsormidium nitens]
MLEGHSVGKVLEVFQERSRAGLSTFEHLFFVKTAKTARDRVVGVGQVWSWCWSGKFVPGGGGWEGAMACYFGYFVQAVTCSMLLLTKTLQESAGFCRLAEDQRDKVADFISFLFWCFGGLFLDAAGWLVDTCPGSFLVSVTVTVEAVVTGMAVVAVGVATVTARLLAGAAAAIVMAAAAAEVTASVGETSTERGLVHASKDAWAPVF